MANKKTTDFNELTAPSADDFMLMVDVSDTTDSKAGSSRKLKLGNLPSTNAIDARSFGAKPDAKTVKDARIANNSMALSSDSASFQASDVGKPIKIYDVTNWVYGVRGVITAYISPSQVTVSAASPVDMLSGDVMATWGTDNSPYLQAALDFAATQVETLNINVNYPIGDGIVTVALLPSALGSKYLINTPITVGRNVRLDGDAMIYNNIGNGNADTAFCIELLDGAHIGKLLLDAAHGSGIVCGTTTGDAHSKFEDIQIWTPGTDVGQQALKIQGFDYRIGNVWIKGANVAVNLNVASDVHFDTVYVMGAQTPVVANGCQNINISKLALDTNVVNGVQIDNSHHIHMNVMSFNNYDGSGGTALANGLLIGFYTGTKCSNINIDYHGVQTGGVGLNVSNAEDCTFKLKLSNAPVFSNANGILTFSAAVNYGANLSGYIDVEAIVDSTTTAYYTGTKYGNLTVRNDANISLLPGANLGIGTTSQFGNGVGVVGVKDAASAPTTNPTGGYVQYSEGGIPKFRTPTGVIDLSNISGSGGGAAPAITADNKTIVIFGSSTAAGVGSTGFTGTPNMSRNPDGTAMSPAQIAALPPLYDSAGGLITGFSAGAPLSATSWAGLLKADLVPKGYTLYAQSIGSTFTASSIQRFYYDVAPLKPKFVVLATSIWNEPGILTTPDAAIQTFLANTYTLCRMVESIGAIPIIIGQYASWKTQTASGGLPITYDYAKVLYPVLERIAPVVWDFMTPSDNGSGTWLSAALTGDYTHPTDLGHSYFYDVINETGFDQLGHNTLFPLDQPRGWWQLAAASSTAYPMTVTLDRPVKSWTIRTKVRADVYGQSKVFLSAGVGAVVNWRLRNPVTAAFTLTDSTTNADLVTSTVNPSDMKVHDLVVTYHHFTNLIKLYVDGSLIGSATPNYAKTALTDFTFGGRVDGVSSNAVSHTFADMAIWRSPLSAADIAAMYKSDRIPTASLEALATCSHAPNLSYAQNAACTTTVIKTPSVWLQATPVLRQSDIDAIASTATTAAQAACIPLTGGTVATTWNNAATAFTALAMNITDTASLPGSLLQDWQVGGISKVSIKKSGEMVINGINAGLGAGTNSTATSFGLGSLLVNTTGANSSAFGYNTLAANTTGNSNTAIGAYSLSLNTVGFQNTAVGKDTLKVSLSGNQNTAFGNSSLIANTTGSSNSANGFNALLANTTGSFNTAFGNGALSGVTTGSNNIGLGFNAGTGIAGTNYNVVLGSYTTAIATSNNIIIADGQGNLRLAIDSAGTVALQGAVKLKSYTVATVPSAATLGEGAAIFVTDASIGQTIAWSDGTNWKMPSAIVTLS
ncbi:MAG: LamG-like jellyroll fold domain-containing protein [Methylococcales bacterium]